MSDAAHSPIPQSTDLAIVGAGPIGLELAVACRQAGMAALHLEAECVGRTIRRWPPRTRFLSEPEQISLCDVPATNETQERLLGEEYVAYLRRIVRRFELPIRTGHRVVDLRSTSGGLAMEIADRVAARSNVLARRVVLATGDMHRPRRLGIEGEDLDHVHHTFDDPGDFLSRRVLIVGGRNSAVEAAIRLARAGAEVGLCYRRSRLPIDEISPKLAPVLEEMIDRGQVRLLGGSQPVSIAPGSARLCGVDERGGLLEADARDVRVDDVLVLIGFEADMTLFDAAGVGRTGRGAPVYDERTMETDVPGLYVAGTAAGGDRPGHEFFIETSHAHVRRILAHLREASHPGPKGHVP